MLSANKLNYKSESVFAKVALFLACLERELKIARQNKFEWLTPMLFFVLTTFLFPIAIGTEKQILQTIGPGIIWVALLLASILSVDNLFKADFNDGSLEQILISKTSFSLMVFAKTLTHWLLILIPLLLILPLLGFVLNLSFPEIKTLIFTIVMGSPVLMLIGALGAALTLTIQRSGILLALIMLPLFIPVLIFGTGAVHAVTLGVSSKSAFALLAAMLCLSVTIVPFVTAEILRIIISE